MNTEETLRQLYTSGQISHVDDCRVAIEAVMKSGIKCKALRKKGTDKFYGYHGGEEQWMIMTWFHVYKRNTLKWHFVKLPADAELVNILILEP